jgi:hypothetical protein
MTAALLIASVGYFTAGMALPRTAAAAPPDDSCPLAMAFLCRVLPVAPDLDGDVDLTRQLPPADSVAPPPDSLPAADPCAAGCI